jgi:hypothetical protein
MHVSVLPVPHVLGRRPPTKCQRLKGRAEKTSTTVVVRYGGSVVAAHGCQSEVDEVIEDEMATLATRLC